MAIMASHEALEHAGITSEIVNKKRNQYRLNNIDAERCSVVYGAGSGGGYSIISNFTHHALSRQKKALTEHFGDNEKALKPLENLRHPASFSPFSIPMSMANGIPAGIGIKFSLHGSVKPITQACSSGTTAIGEAVQKIQSGHADMVISGGVEYSYDEYGATYHGFDVARTLAQIPENGDLSQANRPFDEDRSGFLLSQGGAATLIIESEEHLVKRGGTPIAEIVGFSETFDAMSIMAPDPKGMQIERMIRSAIKQAEISPEDIDYINAHGTGTQANDLTESSVIERIFGRSAMVNSTKSILGHSIAASGAIEAAVCSLSLRDNTIHSSRNLDKPLNNLDFAQNLHRGSFKYALSESFAFGGHNSCLVFKSV